MSDRFSSRRVLSLALFATAFVAACSDTPTTAPGDMDAIVRAPLTVMYPSPTAVVIAGADGGAFTNIINANNSGRATTEFWDNYSVDTTTATNKTCNIGFYASGSILPGCKVETPGSTANAGGYAKYWGDNGAPAGAGRDASSFLFNGDYSYKVSLVGAYSLAISEVGYFTVNAGVYTFTAVPAWSNKSINTAVPVNTGGNDWGFYIRNVYLDAVLGCNQVGMACSNSMGGFTANPYQQFSLMLNSAGTKYLVGVEDNRLEIGGSLDSDYNDYIFAISPDALPEGGKGCSHGYWKNHAAPNGINKNQLFSATMAVGSTFENAFGSMTLQQVLSQGGGGLAALGREAVGAYFNALAFPGFEKSAKGVIDQFNAAYPGNTSSYNSLKDEFESLTDVNGRVCGNPTGK